MKEVLKYLGACLFITLVLAKASAFHIYDHHNAQNEQETQCEYCILVIDSQQAELFAASSADIVDHTSNEFPQTVFIQFVSPVNLSPHKADLQSRPPPSTL